MARGSAPEMALRARVRAAGRLLVAYSGGVDSALLATVAAQELGSAAVAVTAVSASLPGTERAAAAAFARSHGIAHVEVCTDELDRPEYVANDGDRCFHCKSALLEGRVDMVHQGGIRPREIAQDKFLPCCSTPDGDIVVDA